MLNYASGEPILQGDRVLYDGVPAEVEFVASSGDTRSPEHEWHVREFGGGVMITEPNVFGRVFLAPSDIDERLVFVSRQP
jgi:hypothetical protein